MTARDRVLLLLLPREHRAWLRRLAADEGHTPLGWVRRHVDVAEQCSEMPVELPAVLVRPPAGAESAEAERRSIIAFLRAEATAYHHSSKAHFGLGRSAEAANDSTRAAAVDWVADRVENGDHLRERRSQP